MKTHRGIWVGGVATALGLAGVVWALTLRGPRKSPSLHDTNPAVRAAAVRHLDPGGDEALLLGALRDDNADVRLLAAMRLHGHDRNATKRAEALAAALKDRHAGVRRQAAKALASIGLPASSHLYRALQDENFLVRAEAAFALGWTDDPKDWPLELPGEPSVAVPLLSTALTDPHVEVRRNAAQTLATIDMKLPEAEVAVAALGKATADPDAVVRERAAQALGDHADFCRTEGAGARAVAMLRKALRDTNKDVRYQAASALGRIAPNTPEVAAALIRALGDPEEQVRSGAESALGKLGPKGKQAAVAALPELRNDPKKEVREAARRVLAELKGKEGAP